MPIYEYQCYACDYAFEQMQKITEDPVSVCPQCGKSKVKRLVSSTAFHLKGSGWYKTDYASKGSSSAKSESKNDKDSSSKTEKKSEKSTSSSSEASSSSSSSGASDSSD